jgi:hypothetical protein
MKKTTLKKKIDKISDQINDKFQLYKICNIVALFSVILTQKFEF